MKAIRQYCDFVVLASVFGFTMLYLISYIMAKIYIDESFEFTANKYRDDIYPSLNSIGYFGISLVLLWNAFRIAACRLTKIATCLYAGITSFSLLYAVFLFEYTIFIDTLLMALIIAISILFFTYIIRRWVS